jgi:septal ring factor EnvC (AmiA/AmiB activator)
LKLYFSEDFNLNSLFGNFKILKNVVGGKEMKNHRNLFIFFIFPSLLLLILLFIPSSVLSQERNQKEKEMMEILNSIRSDMQRINKEVTDMGQSIWRMNERIKDYQTKTQFFESSVSSVLSDIENIKKILDNTVKEVENLRARPDLSDKVEEIEKRLNLIYSGLKFLFGVLIISFFFSFLSLIFSLRSGRKVRRGLRF